MGCNHGKAVRVAPVLKDAQSTEDKNNRSKKSEKDECGSQKSLESGDRPIGSASSRGSGQSNDSGYIGNNISDEHGDYRKIITENSESHIVQEIEKSFQPKELDFCLTGTPAPRNLSAKDKVRLDEQRILESLRNEGLISTSKYEAKNGLAFEVVEASANQKRAPPARLAKLNRKKKKSKTKEEIAEKLDKAEKRRREAELLKIEKINSVAGKSDPNHVHEEQAKQQQALLENTIKKVDTVAENREKRLRELRDKLKAREEHAAKVRLRKKLHIPTNEEIERVENTETSVDSDNRNETSNLNSTAEEAL